MSIARCRCAWTKTPDSSGVFLSLTLACLLALPWGMAWAAEPVSLVLVADPALTDPNFSRTVVLITRTPGDETIGVILNRRLVDGDAPSASPGEPKARELYFGGPLAPRGLIAIGPVPALPEDRAAGAALDVLPGFRLVIGAARVRTMVEAQGAGPLKVFAGYAGWAPGQLEREIARGGWSVLPATQDLVFDPEPETQWDRLSAPLRAVWLLPVGAPVGASRQAATLQRLFGAHIVHAVDRAYIDVPYVAALQYLERNRAAGAAAAP
jgi:putative transcriptional regulator